MLKKHLVAGSLVNRFISNGWWYHDRDGGAFSQGSVVHKQKWGEVHYFQNLSTMFWNNVSQYTMSRNLGILPSMDCNIINEQERTNLTLH